MLETTNILEAATLSSRCRETRSTVEGSASTPPGRDVGVRSRESGIHLDGTSLTASDLEQSTLCLFLPSTRHQADKSAECRRSMVGVRGRAERGGMGVREVDWDISLSFYEHTIDMGEVGQARVVMGG